MRPRHHAELSRRSFQLGVHEQDLYGEQVASLLVDQRNPGQPQAVGAVGRPAEPDGLDPFAYWAPPSLYGVVRLRSFATAAPSAGSYPGSSLPCASAQVS